MTVTAKDLLLGLSLDTGLRWGDTAREFQTEDADAILSAEGPRRHWLLRGRGMSKTTDVAALSLALLLTEAPAKSHSYVYAVDGDQAQLTMDAIDMIVSQTTGVAGAVQVGARSVTVVRTGARLTVETSDGASSLGTIPWLVICDELAAWPSTANHRRLWASIISGLPKMPGSRLVVISTAGSPVGLGKSTWDSAVASPDWHTSRHPGPSPWWSASDVEATRRDLLSSDWLRYIECEWAEGESSLTTLEDVLACTRADPVSLPWTAGRTYVAALDVGTRSDLTAFAIGHTEHREAGRTVVIDRVRWWKPDKDQRVQLSEVETAVMRECRDYRITRLRYDRMQAEQMTQNLMAKGLSCNEFTFSQASTNRLARTLAVALRDRAIELPDEPELQTQIRTVELVETGPGTVKMNNPPNTHDDLPTVVAMVASDLLAQPDYGAGSLHVPSGRVPKRTAVTTGEALRRPAPGSSLAAHLAKQQAKKMPRGVNFIRGVPGAYDDFGCRR